MQWRLIAGTDLGLYGINRFGVPVPLWTGGGVRKLVNGGDYWAILGDEGILVSPDLRRWENRSRGLPEKTIKVYEHGEKSFVKITQDIKDLELNPQDTNMMVCTTKDTVYLSRDRGSTWESLGMPSARTNGIKAVAVANIPELVVFVSHSTYGIYYTRPDRPGSIWTELNRGIEALETTGNSDEVADIIAVLNSAGTEDDAEPSMPVIYASQTFRPRIYQLDWEHKQFTPIWSDTTGAEFGTVDSLDAGSRTLRFLREGRILEMDRVPVTGNSQPAFLAGGTRTDIVNQIRAIAALGLNASCIGLWESSLDPDAEFICLSELWLLQAGQSDSDTTHENNVAAATNSGTAASGAIRVVNGREGLYMPANHAMEARLLNPYLAIFAERGLDLVVIDMKDDYGRFRFTPHNQELTQKGRVFRPVDIDSFLQTMKERGIYTVARIVVFKDPELARKENGKYAIWDSRNNKPWAGYYDTRRQKLPPGSRAGETNSSVVTEILPAADPAYEILRTWYDERWVDPYSEEVWEYTAAIAEELHRRGFDEIQFDYIRFPTDGANLADARYRWRDSGMDMESAMISFLRHVRSRIDAPISVDIYGANGWYRTGARTGQEVELMAPYVDVICPMYYPSHFEQDFLAQSPAERRPYRIYYQGTQRTARIGRGQIIVRPYVQAFYLNVSYDRRYYNPEYVRLEVEGVRAAGTGGLIYWNNSGRYDDIPLKE
ncbi:hypothetical protein FACS189483_08190 [Spirochaetia bacterium]|nr:hypothetical protein FACS189483_08190 [Spirochaetia bacterium]